MTGPNPAPELILYNGRITTNDPRQPEVTALAVKDGLVTAGGDDRTILALGDAGTRQIDLRRRRVIPGLNDSHLHVIRAGLFYNLELRWDGVPRIAEAMRRLQEQAQRTPPPQWVRVIGGWSELQFAEGRMPTLEEINAAAPDTPVFVLHLYDCALLNRAALRALSFDETTPNPPGGVIARDARGQPTGLLIAEPNALILYSAIATAPKLNFPDQLNSTRHFMRELNRFGITSASDAGGGGQNYPEDYAVIRQLANAGDLTVRIAYSLFAQKSGTEAEDYTRWLGLTHPGDGDDLLRVNGAGENLVWSAADFENFLQPRPELRPVMDIELEQVIRKLAEARWPWRIHATYNESIGRFLDLFERVHRDTPIDDLRWFIDHAETITPQNMERILNLGGGIAVQHRMAYQGEYFIRRYGRAAVEAKPPIRKMMELGLPVGAGTDGTRVASYHPWTCLWWLVSGKGVGGTLLTGDKKSRLSREEALRLYTSGSAWFSRDDHRKGRLVSGYLADLAVLNADYFAVEEDEIRGIESVLTILGGKPVYAAAEFSELAPPMPPVSPDWSPVARYGGYDNSNSAPPKHTHGDCGYLHPDGNHAHLVIMGSDGRFWSAGCPCAL
ncbi:MAG: amidohydrolase [Deltaproteobacteria bacterium]|nr:amidohydrolase [Deltaproteobacteria bacterium]